MIFKSISYVTAGLILGRLFSFIKHAIIVKYAGINYSADIFFLANTIPETVTNVMIAGILTGAFIPLASQILAKNGSSAFKKFINNSFYFLGTGLLILAGILFVFAEKFSHLLAPGYNFQEQNMVANILKIFSPGVLFIGMAGLLTGTLQSIEKFLVPSFGLFLANLTTILFIIFYFREYGIYSAAIGTSLGFFLWFIYQIPFTFKFLIPINRLDIKNEDVSRLLSLTIPTILIIAISNFVLIFEKIFATELPMGTITQINLAFRLALIFSSILVLPLGTVLLPKLSKQYTKENFDRLYEIIHNSFVIVSILLVVVVITILINARFIVDIIYRPLGISEDAFLKIGGYLKVYTFAFLGLFFYPIILRVFFAIQKVKYLLVASILGFVSYIVFVFLLISKLQGYVLPLGYGVFYFIVVIFLFWMMKKNIFPNRQVSFDRFIVEIGSLYIAITLAFIYLSGIYPIKLYIQFLISLILIGSYLFLLRKQLLGSFMTYSKITREELKYKNEK